MEINFSIKNISYPIPLIDSDKVRHKPTKVTICEKPYVAWSTRSSTSGKVKYFITSAVCPHRGADLSFGKVCGEKLECPYHGWTVDGQGQTTSPFEKKLKGHTDVFELQDRFGFLWLNGNEDYFNNLQKPNFEFLGPIIYKFNGPLHTTLDLFADGTHLPFVHDRNGPNREQVDETKFEWSESDGGFNVSFDYAQRPFTLINVLQFFIKTRWHVDARIDFLPLRVQYHIYWYRPKNKKIMNGKNGNTFYFYPSEKNVTMAPCLVYQEIPAFLKPLKFLLRPLILNMTNHLLQEDVDMISKILESRVDFIGQKLETYDAPIVKIRKRLLADHGFDSKTLGYNDKAL